MLKTHKQMFMGGGGKMANVCSFCIIVTSKYDKIIQSVQNVGRDFDKKNVESFQNLLDK